MIGASLPQPTRFLPLLSCPFPPTSFPSKSWHPSATHASDVIPPYWGGAAIFSHCKSLNLWSCYTASGFGIYTCVSVCVYEKGKDRWRWMYCVCVCVGAFGLAQCVHLFVWPQNNVHLTQSDMHIDFQTHTGCPVSIATLCVSCLERWWGRQMTDSSDSRREALWSTLGKAKMEARERLRLVRQ